MKVITKQIRAIEAVDKWRESHAMGMDLSGIYLRMKDLGTPPDPDKVDEAIGNSSWTRVPECNECGKEKDTVVMVGEEPDYESNTSILCSECLESALKIINGE